MTNELPHPDDHAIVIGIDYYPQLPPTLKSAEEDAASFADWLLQPDGGGLPTTNVHLLLGKEYGQPENPFLYRPIQQDVDDALYRMKVHKKARVGRRLYFYFSGHGVGAEADNVAMLLACAALDRLNYNIGLREYRNYLHNAAPFDELVFFLDCCRSRGSTSQTIGPGFSAWVDEQRFRLVRQAVFMASLYGQQAFEVPTEESREHRGLLTRALLEGLKERKAADGMGNITAASLRSWIEIRVDELAQLSGVNQKAHIPDASADMLFGPTVEPPSVTYTVQISPGLTGRLLLLGGDGERIREHEASTSPWEFTIPRNGLYMIVHPDTGRELALRPAKLQGDNDAIRF